MKEVLLTAIGTLLLAGCTSAPPTLASVQDQLDRGEAIEAIDPLQLSIAQALAKDKNILRAYLARKDLDLSSPVYVLAPIFEKEYPQAAINAAYSAFYSVVQDGKLELWLVPKGEYKKHFAKSKPIYVRP